MKLPLSFVRGKFERGILLKMPLVVDAAGDRVVALGFTPGLCPGGVAELDAAAALFAAAPDLLDSLKWLVECADPCCDRELPGAEKDLEHALGRARAAISKSCGASL